MTRPQPGETVDIYWNGFRLFALRIERVQDEPRYPGWVTLHGYVRHDGDGAAFGGYWEPRSTFVQPREEGGFRLLDSGERLVGEPT